MRKLPISLFKILSLHNFLFHKISPQIFLLLLFHFFLPFISLSCLIAPVRTCSAVLNRSGYSRHHYLFSKLRGQIIAIFPLNVVLVPGFWYIYFIKLRKSLSIPTIMRTFIKNGCKFYQILFLNVQR